MTPPPAPLPLFLDAPRRLPRIERAILVGCLWLAFVGPARSEPAEQADPRLETTFWVGRTEFGGDDIATGASRTGIRFAEIAAWPGRHVRVWYQLDNGLSIDNLALARAGHQVPAQYVGGFAHYRDRFTTRIEAGWRKLPDGIAQKMVRGEQSVSLGGGRVAKAGVWLGPRDDGRFESVLHLGMGLPAGRGLRLDSTFFYARPGLPDEWQWRTLLSGEYALGRTRLAAGLAAGQEHSPAGARGIWDSFVKVSLPVLGPHQAHVLLRREQSAGRSSTVVALGATLGIGCR